MPCRGGLKNHGPAVFHLDSVFFIHTGERERRRPGMPRKREEKPQASQEEGVKRKRSLWQSARPDGRLNVSTSLCEQSTSFHLFAESGKEKTCLLDNLFLFEFQIK
jgi:hypothetical protein